MKLKKYAPFVLIICALITAVLSFYGDGSYAKLNSLGDSLYSQRRTNRELREDVAELKRQVYGLKNDDRQLERSAREELKLARPSEMVFIFEDSSIEKKIHE